MQSDRSAAVAATSGSVRGLGVCDALHVRLAGVQLAGLVQALEARIAALAGGAPEDAAARGEERRLLSRMRAQLPDGPGGWFALVGPAGLVAEVVQACVVEAVQALARGLGEGVPGTWSPELVDHAGGASAWIATALDCRAVEAYCLETDADPVHAW
jgi:hypothetical protein